LENAICIILGRKPGAIERSSFALQNATVNLNIGIPAQMLANRPDVNQAELEFRSAFELTNAARASFYPNITLNSGMLGYSTVNGLSNFFKPENIFASIIGGITQPLFARKQLTTQLKIAKADQQIALINFEQTVLAAGQEVSDILYSYDATVKKENERNKQVAALKNAVEYTDELLKAGEATYLEVLTAQQTLLQAQLNQVSDKLQQLQATSDLYRALGGGIK
jgi:outer membrane protein TolC